MPLPQLFCDTQPCRFRVLYTRHRHIQFPKGAGKVRSADISFHYSSAVSNSTTALTASGGGTRSGRTTVQVYEDNGCLYYEEVAP